MTQDKISPEADASFHSAVQHLSSPLHSSYMQQSEITHSSSKPSTHLNVSSGQFCMAVD